MSSAMHEPPFPSCQKPWENENAVPKPLNPGAGSPGVQPEGSRIAGGWKTWRGQVLIAALCPFARGESKSRALERGNGPEEMSPLLLPVSQRSPTGISEAEGRRALLHLTPKWVLPPVPEDQTHEPRVSLASNETFHVFCLLFPLVKPALGRLPLLSGSV